MRTEVRPRLVTSDVGGQGVNHSMHCKHQYVKFVNSLLLYDLCIPLTHLPQHRERRNFLILATFNKGLGQHIDGILAHVNLGIMNGMQSEISIQTWFGFGLNL